MSTKFLSPGWRMPRNANQSKSTNYSLDFIPTDIINVSGFSTALSNVNNGTRSSDNNLPFSWSVWFKSRNSSNSQGEIAGYGQAGRNGIRIHNNVFRSNYTSDLAGTTTIIQDKWYHGVVTYDGTTRKIYINGVFDNASDTPASAAISNQPLTIGVYPGGTSSFNGELNELCFFDYALSASQVTTLYGNSTNGVGNPMALPSSPIAYYPLGESAGGFVGGSGTWLTENNAIGDYVFDFSGNKTVGLSQNINLGSQSTISYWVKSTSHIGNYILNNGGNLINTGPYSINEYYTFKPNNSAPAPNSAGMTSSNINTYILSTNWVHWTVVRNGTGCELYANGQFMKTATVANWSGYDTIVSGLGKNASGIVGDASNFLFWNTNLSSTEVETLYNYGSPIQTLASIPQSSNLKAWYKLDASEIYNSSTTEWSIDNNQNPSPKSSLSFNNGNTRVVLDSSSLNITSALTVSGWFRIPTSNTGGGGTNIQFFLNEDGTGGTARNWSTAWRGTGFNYVWFAVFHNDGTSISVNSGSNFTPNDGEWHHYFGTWDGTTNTNSMKLYIDNELVGENTPLQTGIRATSNVGTTLGAVAESYSWSFEGELSNWAVWNSSQLSELSNIYNQGAPATTYTNTPLGWWKLNNTTSGIQDLGSGGNNGVIGTSGTGVVSENAGFVSKTAGDSTGMSQANLVQSNLQTVAPYSKYAMKLDDATLSDYINVPNNSTLQITGNLTLSSWVRIDGSYVSNGHLIAKADSYVLKSHQGSLSNVPRFQVNDGAFINLEGPSALSLDTWHHITGVREGNSLKLYVNGSLVASSTQTIGNLSVNTNDIQFNAYTSNFSSDITLSNNAIWNVALNASEIREIYNEGLPSNLNTFSGTAPVSWWQLGENSSFDGSNWKYADEMSAGNNADSVNTAETALTNGVGTTANGVSSGMSEGNLVGDAPYSTANAISSNMAVTARVTGSGNTP